MREFNANSEEQTASDFFAQILVIWIVHQCLKYVNQCQIQQFGNLLDTPSTLKSQIKSINKQINKIRKRKKLNIEQQYKSNEKELNCTQKDGI